MARQSGIDNDIIAGLRNYPHVIEQITKRANNVNTLKTNLNFIVASAKYLPELQQAIGPDAMAAYRGDMVAGIQASKKQEVLRSADGERGAHDPQHLGHTRKATYSQTKVRV